jgi:hypothetical protein
MVGHFHGRCRDREEVGGFMLRGLEPTKLTDDGLPRRNTAQPHGAAPGGSDLWPRSIATVISGVAPPPEL